MASVLTAIIVIVTCLVVALAVTLATGKPKPKKPKCECFFVVRDNPYCPIHGEPRLTYRRGGHA